MKIKFSASISAETLPCGSIWHVTEKILKNRSRDLNADNVFIRIIQLYGLTEGFMWLHRAALWMLRSPCCLNEGTAPRGFSASRK